MNPSRISFYFTCSADLLHPSAAKACIKDFDNQLTKKLEAIYAKGSRTVRALDQSYPTHFSGGAKTLEYSDLKFVHLSAILAPPRRGDFVRKPPARNDSRGNENSRAWSSQDPAQDHQSIRSGDR